MSTSLPTDSKQDLPAAIKYVSDTENGFYRKVKGKKFYYVDHADQKCSEELVIERIDKMVIPPQWKDVWICACDDGHLQCTGRDQKGRKQYIYHESYVAHRQLAKFNKVIEFATKLPELRAKADEMLLRPDWDHDRMLGLVIRLLDQTHMRIGSVRYEQQNQTYGLTRLRRKHIKSSGRKPMRLAFKGKSGKFRNVTISNRSLKRMVREVSSLPGYELFKYETVDGHRKTISSEDVNHFLHEQMGDAFTAKDFRTWAGTSLAVRFYGEVLAEFEASGKRGKLDTQLVRRVAKELGNTVSVCRQYYIHPQVLALAKKGALPTQNWEPEEAFHTALADYEVAALEIIGGK